MFRLTKTGWRRLAIVASLVAAAVTVVWLMRWRILEDRVRGELKKIASELFDADVRFRDLRGSLVTSIAARDVVLAPRPGSPFRDFTIRDFEIGYGLFGAGSLDIRMAGARFVMNPPSAGPVDMDAWIQTARDISNFRFPGRLRVSDSDLVLPDGRTLHVMEGEISYGSWRIVLAPFSIEVTKDASIAFGKIEAELDPGRLSLIEEGDAGLVMSAKWGREGSRLELRWGLEDGDHLAFEGEWKTELDVRLSARLRRLDSPLAKSLIAGLPIDGEVALDVALEGTPESPKVDGKLELLGLKVEGERTERIVFPLRAEEGVLVLPRTTQQTPVGPLTLEARIPFPWAKPGPPTATVEVANVEALLKRLPPEIRPWIPTGRVEIKGGFESEAWKVTARFEGERYAFPDPVGELTNYVVEADLDAKALRITRLEGVLGGGPIHATGGVDLTQAGTPLLLDLKGTDLLVVTDDLARIRVNPDVHITVTEGPEVKIEGRVEVPLALYYTEFAPATAGRDRRRDAPAPLGLRLLPAEGGGFRIPGLRDLERVTLDLEVVTAGECRIENSTIGVLVEGRLHLTGRASRPAASGHVRATKGQVRLTTGLFLKILRGEADLPAEAGREPTIHFEGSVGRFDREILVTMTGSMAQPSLRLQSNPPRSEEELLAILAFGHAPGQLEGADAVGRLVGKVIDIYSDTWPDADAPDRIIGRIGIDIVGDSQTQRPVAPWELPTRGTSRGTTVRTEYLLNEYFSIVAESDREANLSGDLKLRLRFR
jgi:hypothetical protein